MTKFRAFQGLQWGSEIPSIDNLIICSQDMDGRFKYCARASEAMSFKGIAVESITYSFFDDKFYEVQVVTKSWSNTMSLLNCLVPELGKYSFFEEDFNKLWVWNSDEVTIWCRYNKPSDTTELVYSYKPIKDLIQTVEGIPVGERLDAQNVVMLNLLAKKLGVTAEQLVAAPAEQRAQITKMLAELAKANPERE